VAVLPYRPSEEIALFEAAERLLKRLLLEEILEEDRAVEASAWIRLTTGIAPEE
jgi:hypothetical protein